MMYLCISPKVLGRECKAYKQILNKEYCFTDFSLSSWIQERELDINATLNMEMQKLLLADLGLAAYLSENECSVKSDTQAKHQTGWINGN